MGLNHLGILDTFSFTLHNIVHLYTKIMPKSFYHRVIDVIRRIPNGQVTTYGQIAKFAGNPRGARQVARILHSSARKENLPWHRVINRNGCIALKHKHGYELQKHLLEDEGISFDEHGCIDLEHFMWRP